MIPYTPSTIDSNYYVGIVTNYDPITRDIAVYLPKLMPNITQDNKKIVSPVNNSSINLPVSVISSSIEETSFIWVKAEDKDEPIPTEMSRVLVYFIDGNPEMGYWKKFNPYNIEYDVDSEDKFKKDYLFTINFNYIDEIGALQRKSIDIHKHDNIDVSLPGNMSINIVRDVDNINDVKISIEKE